MDLMIPAKAIFIVCFAVYIGIWILLVFRYQRYSRRPAAEIDIYKLRGMHFVAMLYRYLGWIWILVLGLLIIYILPNVEVVRFVDSGEECSIDRYYSLFYYRGKSCLPFTSYVSNETDSMLAIYNTIFWGGTFREVDQPSEFSLLEPGSMMEIPRMRSGFTNRFERPWENPYSNTQKPRKTEELTIDLYGEALRDTKYIRGKIEQNHELFRPIFHKLKRKSWKMYGSEESDRELDTVTRQMLERQMRMERFDIHGKQKTDRR